MAGKLYQVMAGDGYKKTGLNRKNSCFQSPTEAVSEALALKEKMDFRYKDKIYWDYESKLTGSTGKMKFLKGYLGGDRNTMPFYLQIQTIEPQEDVNIVTPVKPKNITSKDKKVLDRVVKFFK